MVLCHHPTPHRSITGTVGVVNPQKPYLSGNVSTTAVRLAMCSVERRGGVVGGGGWVWGASVPGGGGGGWGGGESECRRVERSNRNA